MSLQAILDDNAGAVPGASRPGAGLSGSPPKGNLPATGLES